MTLTASSLLLIVLGVIFILSLVGFIAGLTFNRAVDKTRVEAMTSCMVIGCVVSFVLLLLIGIFANPLQCIFSVGPCILVLMVAAPLTAFGIGVIICPYQPQ